jgi:lincosamide nucleotidyltransferase A/C/D/E
MRGEAVLETLEWFTAEGVDVWIGGGWGVDALLGRERRGHGDLDASIRAEQLTVALEVLERRGFQVVADWLPTRIALRHPRLGEIDVHPIHFEPDGSAWLPGPGDESFAYPIGSFTHGTIMGFTVPCIDAGLQRTFHLGYEPGSKDRADMRALADAGLIELPVEYT